MHTGWPNENVNERWTEFISILAEILAHLFMILLEKSFASFDVNQDGGHILSNLAHKPFHAVKPQIPSKIQLSNNTAWL